MNWKTWLLIQALDETLVNWADGIGIRERYSFASRPEASLAMEGDDLVLRAVHVKKLFEYIAREVRERRASDASTTSPEPLRAFSSAPYAQLPVFAGKRFFYLGQTFLLRPEGASTGVDSHPYQHRVFRVEGGGADALLSGEIHVKEAKPLPDALLFLDPVPLSLTVSQACDLFFGLPSGAYASIKGAFFLPPVREVSSVPAYYYSREMLRLRRAVRAAAGVENRRSDEPTATRLQRLADDPIVRDVLMDGGSLRLIGDEGRPTQIQVEIWQKGDPVVEARAKCMLDGALPGPEWAQPVCRAIRADLERVVEPAAIQAATYSEPVQWQIAEPPSPNPVKVEGSWHFFQRTMKAQLEKTDAATAESLQEVVLIPASSAIERTFDHSMAERMFMSAAWRCPWSASEPERDGWHRALLELMHDELSGQRKLPEQRVSDWNRSRSGEARSIEYLIQNDSQSHWHVRYSGDPRESEVLSNRLLLPLGAILNARTLHLDQGARSQVDAGLVLA